MNTCTLCKIAQIEAGSWCDPCRKKYLKKYRKDNRAHLKILNQQWRKNNKEHNKEHKYNYCATIKGRIQNMIKTARKRAKEKSMYFNLDISWLTEIFNIQDNKCLLTGINFIIPSSRNNGKAQPFSPSLDRIDPAKGYTKDNTRLICFGLNCCLHDYGDNIFYILANAYINNIIPDIDTLNKLFIEIPLLELNIKQAYEKKYKEGKKGIITSLFRGSKRHAKEKNISFAITKKDIEKLLINIKCILTNIPFDNRMYGIGTSNPFRPSLDRIDSSKGYTKNNIRLVCVAVNFALNEFGEDIFRQICKEYLFNLNHL